MTPATSSEFTEILRSVRNNTVRSRISWDIWWAQEGEERTKHFDAMNRFSEFFRFDAHAHLTATITGAYRLYDKRDDVRSIRTLISSAKSEVGLAPTAVQVADDLLNSAATLEGKLAILRNKAFGHTDLTKTYDEVFDAAQITPFQLRDLLDISRNIVNSFERAIGKVETEFNDNPVGDFRRLLRFLCDRPV